MKPARLALRRDVLGELAPADLRSVAAGAPDTYDTLCCPTVLFSEMFGTCVGCTPSPQG